MQRVEGRRSSIETRAHKCRALYTHALILDPPTLLESEVMGAAQVRSPGGMGGGEGQDEQGVHFTVGGLQEIGSSVDKVKRPVKLLAMAIDIHYSDTRSCPHCNL